MYWLMSISILTIMVGALAVTNNQAQPITVPLVYASGWLPMVLVIIATLFIIISKRRVSPATGKPASLLFNSVTRHLALIIVAIGLLSGSALQALTAHQQAEDTAIANPIRVQARVTIEGISDSVFDANTNSGYRQVVIIEQMSPLIAKLDDKALNRLAVDLENNSLSNENLTNAKPRLLISAYPKNADENNVLAALNELKPGDELLMTLSVQPLAMSPLFNNNPTGFDSYRWLRARHIDGVATVLAISKPINAQDEINATDQLSYLKQLRSRIDQGRWQLRQHFYQEWNDKTLAQQQTRAVTLSLLTGDRSLIDRDTKDLYQLAGISHLLAISGTHVLFLAIMLAGAAVLIFDRWGSALYRYLPRWQLRWWVMIGAAFIYALFTGFDVPAARTAWMLLAIGAVRLTLLPISAMRVLLILAVVMAWFDPFVLWQAGYWLSFIAVALLLKYDNALHISSKNQSQTRHIKQNYHNHVSAPERLYSKLWSLLKRVFILQCWIFIALLPVSLLLFGKVSLWGLVVNLFAIGLFGWVIVPLNLLAGLCYLLSPTVADGIWVLVNKIVASLHELITWLTSLPNLQSAWLFTPITTSMLLISLLLILPWLLPRGLLSRWLALPPLGLLAMTIYVHQHSLTLTPTLYILPTSDRFISAVLLHYPINDDKNAKIADNISWLILADHRPQGARTMPTSLTAEKLSTTLEQQLRTLSVRRLDGIIVQTSGTSMNAGYNTNKKSAIKNQPAQLSTANEQSNMLLAMTVAQLSQRLPTTHYWHAGRHQPWSTMKPSESMSQSASNQSANTQSKSTQTLNNNALISPQHCNRDKSWQSTDSRLKLQAITGWSEIQDTSVWDCALSVDSDSPIRVVQYNAADPLNPLTLSSKTVADPPLELSSSAKFRIIMDASTHSRLWQLWSLLCADESGNNKLLATPSTTNIATKSAVQSIVWLSHSDSAVTNKALVTQRVEQVMTYDNQPLEVAMTLTQNE